MGNRLYILFFLSHLFTSEWYFDDNNYWELNISSRASALGGIDLDIVDNSQNSEFQIYNSDMYGGIVKFNNFFYNYKIDSCHILGNKIKSIKLGLLNRKIDNIINTSNAWSDESNPPSSPSDINNDLIDTYNHNDFIFSVFIPFKNYMGEFALNIKPGFSKVADYSSNFISIDLSYSYQFSQNFYSGIILNNFFSYKKWNNDTIERFYPSISGVINYKIRSLNWFIEIDDIYINHEIDFKNNVKLGLEQFLYDKIYLRYGYNNNHSSIGLGFNIYDIMFDYSYLNHKYLGKSGQITLTFLVHRNS